MLKVKESHKVINLVENPNSCQKTIHFTKVAYRPQKCFWQLLITMQWLVVDFTQFLIQTHNEGNKNEHAHTHTHNRPTALHGHKSGR